MVEKSYLINMKIKQTPRRNLRTDFNFYSRMKDRDIEASDLRRLCLNLPIVALGHIVQIKGYACKFQSNLVFTSCHAAQYFEERVSFRSAKVVASVNYCNESDPATWESICELLPMFRSCKPVEISHEENEIISFLLNENV
jgi:hypothetical protein